MRSLDKLKAIWHLMRLRAKTSNDNEEPKLLHSENQTAQSIKNEMTRISWELKEDVRHQNLLDDAQRIRDERDSERSKWPMPDDHEDDT
jgi:hypothetical protein